MKVAIINDTHFGAKNDSLIMLEYQKKFFENVFFPMLKEEGITTVLDLGDTFDRRKYINYMTLRTANKMFFDPLLENGIDVHCVNGNHTIFYKNTNEINSIGLLLSKYSNINVYENLPTEIILDGTKILMIPWICSDNQKESLDIMKNTNAQIAMGHLQIEGF